jgi:hypothetical protein
LKKFNKIAKSNISPDRTLGKTLEEIDDKVTFYSKELEKAITDFKVKSLSGNDQNAIKLVEASNDINDISKMYIPKLEDIAKDNSSINIDSVKTNPQIITLQEVVGKLDKIAIEVNAVKQPPLFELFNSTNQAIQPKSQHLGVFAHTISSIYERLGRIDTLGIILICMIIDFFAPLAVYLFLRHNESEDDQDNSITAIWSRITGESKNRPSTF